STYAGSTAPVSTSSCPACLIASSAPVAVASRRMASFCRRSPAPPAAESAIDVIAVLDRVHDLRDRGIAEEHLERDDGGVTGDATCAIGKALVADDDVGVRGDLVDRGVLDGDVLLLELALERARKHHAAAHSRVTRDDELVDVRSVDGCHAGL